MFYMPDTYMKTMKQELVTIGWAEVTMMGEADATARGRLHIAATEEKLWVHTFVGGPYGATMYGHTCAKDQVCPSDLTDRMSCANLVQPYVNHNGEWKSTSPWVGEHT